MSERQDTRTDPAAITVAEVMVANVLVVHAGDSIDDAVRLIVDSRITGVPVVDDERHILGIVAESDVLGKPGRTVADVMTRDVVTIEETTTLDSAAETMLTRRIRRLPVIREGRLVGILTRADLLRHVRHTHWTCDWCATTASGSAGPMPARSAAGSPGLSRWCPADGRDPRGHLFTPIFAMLRMAGWTANIMEQHREHRLIRPDSDYVGPRPRGYVPIAAR